MIKTFFKEMIIILLLCVAILILLSVIFYDYNPISKVVPNKIAYSTPKDVREELEEESVGNTISIENKVYQIEGSDLNIYKSSKSYNPGKRDPFTATTSEGGSTTVSTNTSNNNGGDTTTQNNNTNRNDTVGNNNTVSKTNTVTNSSSDNTPKKLK